LGLDRRSWVSVLLTVVLALVFAAPAWHGSHAHPLDPAAASDDPHGQLTHLCDRPAAPAAPGGLCPVCQSHRLLGQGLVLAPQTATPPLAEVETPQPPQPLPAQTVVTSAGARAPPRSA